MKNHIKAEAKIVNAAQKGLMENWWIIAKKKFVNDDWNIHLNFENTFAMNIMNTFCIKHGRGLEDFSFVHSEGFVVVETSEFGNMLSVFCWFLALWPS